MFCLGVMAWWSRCDGMVVTVLSRCDGMVVTVLSRCDGMVVTVLSRCDGMVVTVFCLGVMAWWSPCSVSV